MKKVLIALSVVLLAMCTNISHAQQNAQKLVTGTLDGKIVKPAYRIIGAPGNSDWFVDFTTPEGKKQTQGISIAKAAEINKILANNNLQIVAHRTEGGGEQGDSIQIIKLLPKKQ